jgi:hypothetical protein
MQTTEGAIEQLDEAAQDASFVLLAVGLADGRPAFISESSADRLERLREIVRLGGAAPVGIIRVVEKNEVEFKVEARPLKEYASAPSHVREDATEFLDKAVVAAADEITAFIKRQRASHSDGNCGRALGRKS